MFLQLWETNVCEKVWCSETNRFRPHGGTACFWLIHLCRYIYIFNVTLKRWEGILSILKCLTSWIKFSIAGTEGRQGKNERGPENGVIWVTLCWPLDLLTPASLGVTVPQAQEKPGVWKVRRDRRSSWGAFDWPRLSQLSNAPFTQTADETNAVQRSWEGQNCVILHLEDDRIASILLSYLSPNEPLTLRKNENYDPMNAVLVWFQDTRSVYVNISFIDRK